MKPYYNVTMGGTTSMRMSKFETRYLAFVRMVIAFFVVVMFFAVGVGIVRWAIS